jgi:hypothetical protein
MCMGCMANADFMLTSGIVGAASLRVAARSALPGVIRRPRKVTDAEVSEFLAGLHPVAPPGEPSDAPASAFGPTDRGEPVLGAEREPAALVP